MRLRNKKTGEIPDKIETIAYIQWSKKIMMVYINSDGVRTMKHYDSLNDFNEEWEDYEEPEKYWFIDAFGNIVQNKITKHYGDEYTDMTNAYENQKQIGNYFETEEEAEKAVEKLKALTEAKEDGLKIKGYYYNHEDLVILADIGKCNKLTLDTLFGKEID